MDADIEEARFGFVHRVQRETRACIDRVVRESDRLRAVVESVEFDRKQIQHQLELAIQERDGLQSEVDRLRKSLATSEAEHESFFEAYARVESQSMSLANLYVATYRLHGSLDREEVLDVIEEIVANLIGSEEIAILEAGPEPSRIEVLRARGVDRSRLESIVHGDGAIGRALASGVQFIRSAEDSAGTSNGPKAEESELTACIPLRVCGRVTGAIAIYRLLKQKPGLEPVDFELFELLGEQAGVALYTASLAERDVCTAARREPA